MPRQQKSSWIIPIIAALIGAAGTISVPFINFHFPQQSSPSNAINISNVPGTVILGGGISNNPPPASSTPDKATLPSPSIPLTGGPVLSQSQAPAHVMAPPAKIVEPLAATTDFEPPCRNLYPNKSIRAILGGIDDHALVHAPVAWTKSSVVVRSDVGGDPLAKLPANTPVKVICSTDQGLSLVKEERGLYNGVVESQALGYH